MFGLFSTIAPFKGSPARRSLHAATHAQKKKKERTLGQFRRSGGGVHARHGGIRLMDVNSYKFQASNVLVKRTPMPSAQADP